MIKINLLPPSIFETKAIKRLVAVFVAVAVVIVAGGFLYTMQVKNRTDAKAEDANFVEGLSKQADNWRSQAESQRGSIKPITQKLEFFKAVAQHNNAYPDIYEDLSRFTYGKITYGKLTVSSGTITLEAHAPSLGDAGRYLMNLYRATHLFSSISMSQVPGYTAVAQASATTSIPGTAPPAPTSMTTGMARYGPGGSAAYGGYAGLSAIASGVTKTMASEPGFDFSVTCMLKSPPAMPVFGGAAQTGTPGVGPSVPMPPPVPAAPTSYIGDQRGWRSKMKGGVG